MNQAKQSVCCPVCLTGSMPYFRKRSYNIYKCYYCGCLTADLEFEHEQYEQSDYYTMKFDSRDEIEIEWGMRWAYILDRLDKVSEVPQASQVLLDVGAGNGHFMNKALSRFSGCRGLEISSEEIRFAKRIFEVTLENTPVQEITETYDVVSCLSVLEHVENPCEFLRMLLARVKPGGVLVVTTPNTRCIQSRLLGKHWRMIDPPHHINLFSRTALQKMIEGNGFHVVDYQTLSTYIRPFRRIPFLRRMAFNVLRLVGLGADHLMLVRQNNSQDRLSTE